MHGKRMTHLNDFGGAYLDSLGTYVKEVREDERRAMFHALPQPAREFWRQRIAELDAAHEELLVKSRRGNRDSIMVEADNRVLNARIVHLEDELKKTKAENSVIVSHYTDEVKALRIVAKNYFDLNASARRWLALTSLLAVIQGAVMLRLHWDFVKGLLYGF